MQQMIVKITHTHNCQQPQKKYTQSHPASTQLRNAARHTTGTNPIPPSVSQQISTRTIQIEYMEKHFKFTTYKKYVTKANKCKNNIIVKLPKRISSRKKCILIDKQRYETLERKFNSDIDPLGWK